MGWRRLKPVCSDSALGGAPTRANGAGFSPDGSLLLTTHPDGLGTIWSIAGENALGEIRHGTGIEGFAFSADGGRLATADGTELRVWDPHTAELVTSIERDTETSTEKIGRFVTYLTSTVALSPDGSRLVAGAVEWVPQPTDSGAFIPRPKPVLGVWDAGTGERLETIRGLAGAPRSLAYSPDGQVVAVEHAGGVGIAMMGSDRDVRPVARLDRRLCGLAIAPGGGRAALCHDDGGIAVLDLASAAEIARFEGEEESYEWLSFAPDGSVLLGLTRDGECRLWRQYSGAELIEEGRGVVARLQPLGPDLECRFHLRTEGCMRDDG